MADAVQTNELEATGARAKQQSPSDVELELSFLPHETIAWQRGAVVGSGRFGQVVLALRVPSAELLAVKLMYVQEDYDQGNDASSLCMQRVLPLAKIEREVDIVESIQHPNVVRFLGCERYGPVYRIFMEYLAPGSLSRLLKQLGPFDESATRHFVRQVLDGVAYLHRVGIAHRDLKCANLLLAGDGTVKISDFGTAKRVATDNGDSDDDEYTSQHETARSVREGLGSPYWMAPELVRAERGDDGWRKADVWGVGCVTVELLTGKPPWENHSNPLTAMFHIASKDSIPPLPPTASASARSFLLACFDKNPSTRPEAHELLQHPFLTREKTRRNSRPMVFHDQPHQAVTTEVAVAGSAAVEDTQSLVHQASDQSIIGSDAQCSSPSSDEDDEVVTGETLYSSDEDSDAGTAVPDEPAARPQVTHRPSATLFTWVELGRVRALADYSASDENELSLREGETMVVAGANEFGWWRGKHENAAKVGWFPCTYVEWVPGSEPFIVRQAFTPEPVADGQLALAVGDSVDLVHCEWRSEQLWAYGRCSASQCEGWFPFSCIVESTLY